MLEILSNLWPFLWLGKEQKQPQYNLVPFYCYALTFVGVHCTTHIATFAHCRQLKCMSGLDSYTNQWPLFYTCRNLWLNGCLQAPEITCFLIIHPSTKTKTTAVSPEASLLSALFCKKQWHAVFCQDDNPQPIMEIFCENTASKSVAVFFSSQKPAFNISCYCYGGSTILSCC